MAVTSNAPDSSVIWFCKMVALCKVPMSYFWKCLLWAHKQVRPQEMLAGLIYQAPAEDPAPAGGFPFQLHHGLCQPHRMLRCSKPHPCKSRARAQQPVVCGEADLCSHSELLQGTWKLNPLPFHPPSSPQRQIWFPVAQTVPMAPPQSQLFFQLDLEATILSIQCCSCGSEYMVICDTWEHEDGTERLKDEKIPISRNLCICRL